PARPRPRRGRAVLLAARVRGGHPTPGRRGAAGRAGTRDGRIARPGAVRPARGRGLLRRAARHRGTALSLSVPGPDPARERTMIRAEVYGRTLRYLFAPVAHLLYEDETVTEVLINGPHTVYIERAGRLERTDCQFADEEALLAAVRNLAEYVQRRLDED